MSTIEQAGKIVLIADIPVTSYSEMGWRCWQCSREKRSSVATHALVIPSVDENASPYVQGMCANHAMSASPQDERLTDSEVAQ